ncbi:hypothetical protein BG005_010813 [Podila minutissima]|nr:hypothetical protein BG005_010813 [Podila minutissima]
MPPDDYCLPATDVQQGDEYVFSIILSGPSKEEHPNVHQQILAQHPTLANLIEKLKVVEGSSSDSEVVSGVKSHHVTDYSLESYCCLVRFIYTGDIKLDVDLDDFAIGCPPNKPFSVTCKERPSIAGLFSTTNSSAPEVQSETQKAKSRSVARTSSYSELFQLADCFAIKNLRDFCRDKIIAFLTPANALGILFGYAYQYADLKAAVLSLVAKNMDTMYSDDKDPFEPYADHPKCHTLLTEALQLKLKNLQSK